MVNCLPSYITKSNIWIVYKLCISSFRSNYGKTLFKTQNLEWYFSNSFNNYLTSWKRKILPNLVLLINFVSTQGIKTAHIMFPLTNNRYSFWCFIGWTASHVDHTWMSIWTKTKYTVDLWNRYFFTKLLALWSEIWSNG